MCNRLKAKRVVPVFYTKGAIELITYTFFRARLDDPENTQNKEQIAKALQSSYDWDEDDYPLATIRQTYYRMEALHNAERISIKNIFNYGPEDKN